MSSTKYEVTDKGDYFTIMRPRSKKYMQVMCWDADTAECCCAALNKKEAGRPVRGVPPANNERVEICEWIFKTDAYYYTTCGEIVQSLLSIDGMKFCPYCSRKLTPIS